MLFVIFCIFPSKSCTLVGTCPIMEACAVMALIISYVDNENIYTHFNLHKIYKCCNYVMIIRNGLMKMCISILDGLLK